MYLYHTIKVLVFFLKYAQTLSCFKLLHCKINSDAFLFLSLAGWLVKIYIWLFYELNCLTFWKVKHWFLFRSERTKSGKKSFAHCPAVRGISWLEVAFLTMNWFRCIFYQALEIWNIDFYPSNFEKAKKQKLKWRN